MAIYVHGIGEHPPKEQWKREWDLALFGKPMGDRTSMAYWSDILHGPSAEGSVGAQAIRSRAIGNPEDDSDLDVDQILAGLKIPAKVKKAVAAKVESLSAAIAKNNGRAADSRRGPSAKILPLPGFLRRPIAKAFLERFIKDVAAYFYQPGARKKIQDRLRAEIKKKSEPFVLVSHSLGTVVAFEVLSEKLQRQDCSLMVTMGSPLGIDEVQDVMQDFGGILRVPPGVRAWHNFADRIDPVAADGGLTNDFESRPAPGNRMVRIINHQIVNERTTNFREFNPHSSLGYLSHPKVRSVVHHETGFDSNGRFLVARDVAEEFVRPDRRIPVLIEALEPGYWAVDEGSAEKALRESQLDQQQMSLPGRIAYLKQQVEEMVVDLTLGDEPSKKEAEELRKEIEVMALRKFVSAKLTPDEINHLTAQHRELNIYAVWRNSAKRKVLERSHGPVKADAGRTSFGAAGRNILWAVLDTGVYWDHPHFQARGNIAEVWDCTTGTDEPEQIFGQGTTKPHKAKDGDRDGHGTHVSGIIAGEFTSGSSTIQGIAPETKLIVYKVLDDDGNGSDAWIIKAIDHIFMKNQSVTSGLKVHGVNLSLGGPFDPTVYGCGFSPICQELRGLWQQGTLVCVAAGNEGQISVQTTDGSFDLNTQLSIGDPANLEAAIAVGSVNADKPHLYGVSYFSSRGPTADGRPKPDCVAPGERILSCNARLPSTAKLKAATINDLYRHESGTSMACPHVSGMLAAFLSVRREYIGRPDDVKKILLENCNDLGRDRYHQGAGMPNLMKMLTNT